MSIHILTSELVCSEHNGENACMNSENTSTSHLDLALSIASDPAARAVIKGPAPAASRGVWGSMNLKVKLMAVAIPAGVALFANPFGNGQSAPKPVSAKIDPIVNAQTAPASQVIEMAPNMAFPATAMAAAAAASAVPSAAPADRLAKALPNQGVGMNSRDISLSLMNVDLFASLVTAIEDFKSKPYYDPGGLNVGMGYCITKRIAEYGKTRIEADLTTAGFTPDEVDTLIKNKRSAVSKITVTPLHAVKLIEAVREDYNSIARGAVGAEHFDKMAPHQQASIQTLAYNTGDVGKFKNLVAALRGGNDAKAMLNMTVSWRDSDGELHANHRHRAYLQSMFLGPEHFKRAIADPNAFESHMASPGAESALAEIAAAAQKPEGLRSKLLEKRLKANPWAFKALGEEKEKLKAKSL